MSSEVEIHRTDKDGMETRHTVSIPLIAVLSSLTVFFVGALGFLHGQTVTNFTKISEHEKRLLIIENTRFTNIDATHLIKPLTEDVGEIRKKTSEIIEKVIRIEAGLKKTEN